MINFYTWLDIWDVYFMFNIHLYDFLTQTSVFLPLYLCLWISNFIPYWRCSRTIPSLSDNLCWKTLSYRTLAIEWATLALIAIDSFYFLLILFKNINIYLIIHVKLFYFLVYIILNNFTLIRSFRIDLNICHY